MATYYEYTISNVFEIENETSFINEIKKMNGENFFYKIENNKYVIKSYDSLCSSTENSEEEYYYYQDDYYELIQKYIKENQIVLISSIGYGKLRYFTAGIVKITKDNIESKDAFESVKKELGVEKINIID